MLFTLRGLEEVMSEDVIYSDVKFIQNQKQGARAKGRVFDEALEREEDVTYSEVTTRKQGNEKTALELEENATYSEVRTRKQGNDKTGMDSKTCPDGPSPPVETKIRIPKGRILREALLILVCFCGLLLALVITLGLLYALNKIDLKAEKDRVKECLRFWEDQLSMVHHFKMNLSEVNDLRASNKDKRDILSLALHLCETNRTAIIKLRESFEADIERFSSELQNNKRNNTELKHLLKKAQADIERFSSELQNNERNNTELKHLLEKAQKIRCASGWEYYNGSCYYFSQDRLTWEQSQYACIHDGGHLVIIESQQEQDFLRKKVGNTDYMNAYWIGMTDSNVEGTWVWMDNTTLNNNTKYWDLNNGTNVSKYPEPNDWEKAEDCAQMGGRCSDQTSCWLDNGCNKASKRICESHSIK